jgi:uncharacterized protein YxjI
MSAILEKNRLFFNQKAKLFELTSEYAIKDEDGAQVGAVREEGQSAAKKILRAVSKLDQFMTHTLSAYDADGTKVLELVRPRKFMKSKLLVKDGAGADIGTIAQKNMIGKIRFSYEDAKGEAVGSINAENWRAWNFRIDDAQGNEVGRITKKWAGIGKELFTTADNYLFEINEGVAGTLRMLALASAVGVDLALKQDE